MANSIRHLATHNFLTLESFEENEANSGVIYRPAEGFKITNDEGAEVKHIIDWDTYTECTIMYKDGGIQRCGHIQTPFAFNTYYTGDGED